MKKVLFIDRDGTLIHEPPDDFQVDTLEKLEFIPGVFRNLYFIRKYLDFELVMVSNQDGLGTESYPEKAFWLVQHKILRTFENEGIVFDDILIDRTFPEENASTRKPGVGMLTRYTSGNYDLANSYVIGDRLTDIELAVNLGTKAILFKPLTALSNTQKTKAESACTLFCDSWDEIYRHLALESRSAMVIRKTEETDITVKLNLDGTGKSQIQTGLGFFDHLLSQLARHSGCDLEIIAKGDLHVDEHHTIEDTALATGEAFHKALGSKRGIERYGFALPMDDCMAHVMIDFGGRPWLIWDAAFKREQVGEMPTEMFMHFFKSFADAACCNLNIKASGDNEHHKIEAIFKALARAIKMAIRREPFNFELPTTKGLL
jgi:imidazoleglycerol-phosphate dehydratase/histidinol-phosphatase